MYVLRAKPDTTIATAPDGLAIKARHNKSLAGHSPVQWCERQATRWRDGTSDIGTKPVAAMPVRRTACGGLDEKRERVGDEGDLAACPSANRLQPIDLKQLLLDLIRYLCGYCIAQIELYALLEGSASYFSFDGAMRVQ